MRWFCAINEASLDRYSDLLLVAVHSALARTTLEPHLLYDGSDNAFIASLERRGVAIHRTRVSFYNRLEERAIGDGFQLATALGAYLRLEIPNVEAEVEYCLYTDVDVMFKKDEDWHSFTPRIFSAVGEYDRSEAIARQSSQVFNSGVMVINVAGFREILPGLYGCLEDNNFYFHGRGGYYDQGAMNAFFGPEFERLPNALNWRPFAREQAEATIIHFHGPKPEDIRRCQAGDASVYTEIREMYDRNPEGYAEACDDFYRLLGEAKRDR